MARFLVVGLLASVFVAGFRADAQSIQLSSCPIAVDTSSDATPFAVFLVISDWEELANQQVNTRITRIGSGSHFRMWRDSVWISASLYSNCPVVTLDSTGGWAGWMYLRADGVSSSEFKAFARRADTTAPQVEEAEVHSIMLVDGATSSGWLEGHVYIDPGCETPAEGITVLAVDSEQRIAGVYVAEDNTVDEGYPMESGYFKVSSPAGMIESLEFRNQAGEIVQGHTLSSPPWIVTAGSVRSVDDSSTCVQVTVRDTFGMAAETLIVPVAVDSTDGLGICALEFSIHLDGDLVELSSVDTSSTLLSGAGWFFHYVIAGETLSVAAAGPSDLSGAGPLINLHFAVNGGASLGCSTSIHVDNLLLNESGAGPEVHGEGGTFIVVSRWGDVSGDTEVHAYDAALLLKWLVDPALFPLFHHQLIVGDADLDGEITAYDASLVLQHVVGSVDELPHPGLKFTPATLRLTDFEGCYGDTVSLMLVVDEGEDMYSLEGTISFEPSVLEMLEVKSAAGGHLFWQNGVGEIRFALARSEPFARQDEVLRFDFAILPGSREGSTVTLRSWRTNNLPVQHGGSSAEFRVLHFQDPALAPRLYCNYPNPFRKETEISFALGQEASVQLKVYNSAGELVRTIADKTHGRGYHSYRWDGRDGCGRRLSSGVYFYRMDTEDRSETRKMSMIQ